MCEIARTNLSVKWQTMPANSEIDELTNELRLKKYGQQSYNCKR